MGDSFCRSPVVVKVGGSLFDLPDLGRRLRHWLEGLATREIVLVPGGGPIADAVRDLDRRHRLGEEASHWLALGTLRLNAHFLAALLSGIDPVVIEAVQECPMAWQRGQMPIVDGQAFARVDEGRPGCLPHGWAVTSDSLAVRVAAVLPARRLILLKSITIPAGTAWSAAAERGLVDGYFAQAVGASPQFAVQAINFREPA